MTAVSRIDTADTPARASHVGDRLRNAMSPADLRAALNLGERNFYKLQKEGRFKRFLLARPMGVRRYSGQLVKAYLDGGGK